MTVDINRVLWTVPGRVIEGVAELFKMMVEVLIIQDDLRRWKKGDPETGVIEDRSPEKLIATLKEECDEYAGALASGDRVNEYEEAADLLLRLFRLFATRGLHIRAIIRIFFAKMRAIAESDIAQQKRNKVKEREVMTTIVREYEEE